MPALSLQDKMGDDGKPLVELPKNYLAMVESLLMARRHEYAALDGWLGPTRFQSECGVLLPTLVWGMDGAHFRKGLCWGIDARTF